MKIIVPMKEAEYYVKEKVNLLGVIMEFSLPRKSNGTDYVSILKIVDDSQQSPELTVSIFTKELDHLPFVRSRGDFILLRSVMIELYGRKLSAFHSKKYSSFALFDGKGSGHVPYQSFPGFCLTHSEQKSIARLKNWYPNFQFNAGTSEYLRSLKDITEECYFDLVCKVFDVHENLTNVWMLFVWDGTDVPPLNLHGNLRDEEENPLPLEIERRRLPRDILRKFRTVGTVLRVTADEAHEGLGDLSSIVGKWVRIRNMTAKAKSGMWHGILLPSSRIRLLSEDDNVVEERISKYNERKVGEQGQTPMWSSPPYPLTVMDKECECLPFWTLMDLLCRSKVNNVYKCIVRVVGTCPSQVKDFCTHDGSRSFRVKLTLEDSTTRIHALLCDEEGVKFFEDCSSIDAITIKMNKLLGVPENNNVEEGRDFTRCPPWIQCGLYAKDSDALENRLFYICCTRIVG